MPAASVAGDREQPLVGDPKRGARIAPLRDIGVELVRCGGEPLAVLSVGDRPPAVDHEPRPRLQQVPGRLRAEVAGGRREGRSHIERLAS